MHHTHKGMPILFLAVHSVAGGRLTLLMLFLQYQGTTAQWLYYTDPGAKIFNLSNLSIIITAMPPTKTILRIKPFKEHCLFLQCWTMHVLVASQEQLTA